MADLSDAVSSIYSRLSLLVLADCPHQTIRFYLFASEGSPQWVCLRGFAINYSLPKLPYSMLFAARLSRLPLCTRCRLPFRLVRPSIVGTFLFSNTFDRLANSTNSLFFLFFSLPPTVTVNTYLRLERPAANLRGQQSLRLRQQD